jgi:hypothetical protein
MMMITIVIIYYHYYISLSREIVKLAIIRLINFAVSIAFKGLLINCFRLIFVFLSIQSPVPL